MSEEEKEVENVFVPEEVAEPQLPSPEEVIAKLAEENTKLKDQALRAMAEAENTRRRSEREIEDKSKFAIAKFAAELLPVADNLRRALESINPEVIAENEIAKNLLAGVELVEKSLQTALEKFQVKQIKAEGERFDPNFHQAMMEMEDITKQAGTIVQVLQQGYVIHERLLRPSMVIVAKGGPKPAGLEVDTQA